MWTVYFFLSFPKSESQMQNYIVYRQLNISYVSIFETTTSKTALPFYLTSLNT